MRPAYPLSAQLPRLSVASSNKCSTLRDTIRTGAVVSVGFLVCLSVMYFLYGRLTQHSPNLLSGLSAISVAMAGEVPARVQRAEATDLESMCRAVRQGKQDQPSIFSQSLCAAASLYRTYRSDNVSVSTNKDHNLFLEGERLMVNLRSDAFAINFVYVDYYAMDGSVTHLFSSKSTFDPTANQLMTGEEIWLGEPGDVERWDISAPFGTEFIGVIVSSSDLDIDSAVEVELAQTYLQRIAREMAANPVQVVSELVPINTMARQL